ncbi:hypothetical protein [Olivibacter domesticus]|uniref:Uncharacterized protein n=1 Tax=Olivibacter domesticus TaxID=407022 RepID=A0A1H7LR37_OLID1|nr:hypothetical protein [Olivibacter domesticus]SEL00935.1 hypothetical protein SAMN05661044_01734 [Olivibacter domesticus]
MKRIFRSKMRFVFFPLAGIAFVFLVSLIVMLLWNYTLPDVLGTKELSYWQAMTLFFLCKILFGFGGGGRKGPPWAGRNRHKNMNQWNEEEREKFKGYMQKRWCNWNDEGGQDDKNNSQYDNTKDSNII